MSEDFLTDEDGPGFYEEIQEPYEPLRQELYRYLEKSRWGHFIRHPFCNDLIQNLDYCSRIHEQIDERAAVADKCFEDQDWEGYLGCIDVSLQPEWFDKDKDLISDQRYWELLGYIYKCQKYTHHNRGRFDRLLRSERPGRELIMSAAEREVLAQLPDVLTVYRGVNEGGLESYADGVAWTLDRREAVYFANQYLDVGKPYLIRGKIRKQAVWAYLSDHTLLLPSEQVNRKRWKPARCKKATKGYRQYIRIPFDVTKLFGKA